MSWGSAVPVTPDKPDWVITVETIPLYDGKQSQHKIEARILPPPLPKRSGAKLERQFRPFHFSQAGTGFDHSHSKKIEPAGRTQWLSAPR